MTEDIGQCVSNARVFGETKTHMYGRALTETGTESLMVAPSCSRAGIPATTKVFASDAMGMVCIRGAHVVVAVALVGGINTTDNAAPCNTRKE